MTITFYYNQSDINVMDKDIRAAFAAPFVGVLRDESCSVLRPTIRMQMDPADLVNVNYFHIAEFNRYYYLADKAAVRDDLVDITGKVDPLMSYKTGIRKSTALIKRNAYQYNLKINDGSLATYSDGYVLAYKFSGGFAGENLILITAGGT